MVEVTKGPAISLAKAAKPAKIVILIFLKKYFPVIVLCNDYFRSLRNDFASRFQTTGMRLKRCERRIVAFLPPSLALGYVIHVLC